MAQTFGYFLAGYFVIFTGLAGYLISLALRWKKLSSEKDNIQNIG